MKSKRYPFHYFDLDDAGLPSMLYHYTSLEALLSIVKSGCMRATHIRYLNDHSELDWLWDAVDKLLVQKWECEKVGPRRELLELLTSEVGNGPKFDAFVASFSQDGDDLSQWRGYCSGGTGVSIGFDSQALKASWVRSASADKLLPAIGELQRVRYLEAGPNSDLSKELDLVLKEAMNYSPFPQNYKRIMKISAKADIFKIWISRVAPLCKHHAFSSENEWRLVLKKQRDDELYQQFRAGKSSIVPYVEAPLNLNSEKVPEVGYMVRKVIVGPTPSMPLAVSALKSFFTSLGHPEVEIDESRIPYRHW
jgi:Protein of unknown function (DUF2971)